jgi:tRNA uridine 5-carboxymethylaminomethyl modification enzyme
MQNGQIQCYIASTNAATHKIINDNYHLAPRLGDSSQVSNSGKDYGTGPRYCPSIEKKLWVFPDKLKHNIWLEPEGIDSDVVYPNGLSTGLPKEA